ncbi:GMC family oxidoreductase [Planctomycetota bacterium]|nr:GMC family oxidoreductase [Planctomycetota bacterium]
MLINGDSLDEGSEISSDICIIGGGAAGLSIAAEFNGTGHTVSIIESGGLGYSKAAQALNEVETTALPIGSRARFRQFGGSTTEWSGKWLMLTSQDFTPKAWLPHSDWPLSHEDLLDYYERAALMHRGPEVEQYLKVDREQRAHVDEVNSPVQTVPVFWLGALALDFSTTVGQLLRPSGEMNLYHSLSITNIALDAKLSSVASLDASTAEGRKFKIRAKHYILAGGGIENARLLLASNTQAPKGVGNLKDVVGRYYMDHPSGCLARVRMNAGARFPDCLGLKGVASSTHRVDLGLRLSDEFVRQQQTMNSYVVWRPVYDLAPSQSLRRLFASLVILSKRPGQLATYAEVIRNLWQLEKVNFLKVAAYRLSLRIGLKDRRKANHFRLNFHIEQSPRPENQISLSSKKDPLGNPLSTLHWTLGDEEIRSVRLLHTEIKKIVDVSDDLTFEWLEGTPPDFSALQVSDSSHHMGSTRMGVDPATSVVDRDCKVHGIDNLHIAGSSVFPRAGFANPTFTIVAFALRLADRVKQIISPT